jgi:type IV pilus assembly protein PilM
MIRLLSKKKHGPIGVDMGTRSVKLLQLSADHERVIDAVRWDFPGPENSDLDGERTADRVADVLRQAQEGRSFRGRDVTVCVRREDLFLQNLRVPKASEEAMQRAAQQEASSRLPYPVTEAELHVVPVAEVRQQETVVQEVLFFACQRERLRRQLDVVEKAGLNPVAVDIEPAALLRSCRQQYRREEDRKERLMYAHIGFSDTTVVIAEGDNALLVKYIGIGGRHMDEAVAQRLDMTLVQATALRRHNGDRRSDQQDPAVAQSIAAAIRPVVERLAGELAMCIRYYSVTFRGKPLARVILGGGEANAPLSAKLAERLELKCELADPLRTFDSPPGNARAGQWDVAAGLALKRIT